MSYPEHEAELERQFYKAFLHTLCHPREWPSFLTSLFRGTRSYYAGQDLADLGREDLVRLVAFLRKMVVKACGAVLFMGIFLLLALVRTCKAEEPWTPDDFDWGALQLQIPPKDQWHGLYINLTETPLPAHAELMQVGKLSTINGDPVLEVSFLFGLAWQAANFAVAAGGIATAIQGCVTTDGSAGSVAGCVFGIAGTIASIGSAYKAAQARGWFASAANTWVCLPRADGGDYACSILLTSKLWVCRTNLVSSLSA